MLTTGTAAGSAFSSRLVEGQVENNNSESEAEDEVRTTFIPLDSNVPGLLYQPSSNDGNKSHVGVVVMHGDSDFLTHPTGPELSKRGYHVLTANTRASQGLPALGVPGEGYYFEEVIPDVAKAVQYLKDLSEIEHIVLVGHSGGGPLFTFYQNVAENGSSVCQGCEKLSECSDELGDYPPGDGLVLLDGHLGYGVMGLNALDPAIVAGENPRARNPDLDMFNPANGYDPDGSSYSEEFVDRFVDAQASRMQRLISDAEHRVEELDAGYGDYRDDEPFHVPALEARIWLTDTQLLSRTQEEWPLLYPDGTVEEEVVESVRPAYSPETSGNLSYQTFDGDLQTSVRKYLNTHAISPTSEYNITEDSLTGIDWSSSLSATPSNIEGVSVPLFQLPMTGFWFVTQNEIVHKHATTSDKEILYIEGASHEFTPIREEFGDTFEKTFDQIDRWMAERYV